MNITELKEKVSKDCDKMATENNIKWCELAVYLEKEVAEGKIDFHLRVHGNGDFYIHPQGKDGNTLNSTLNNK